MRRVSEERGAVAVIVAFLMVPLVGFAALSLDVAGALWEKQQLQTGADAAALAIAQACGRRSCGSTTVTAQTLVSANHKAAGATASVTFPTSTSVTVEAKATRQHAFAPILGVDPSKQLTARATAGWGNPSGGTAVLPLAFSWCEWNQQASGGVPTGTTDRTIYLTKTSGTTDCTGPSNLIVPGGFGWLTVNSGTCSTRSTISDVLMSDPGNSVPSGCSTSSFSNLIGQTVLLPLFDQSSGTGSSAQYRVYGYAAFTLAGYDFGGQFSSASPCHGNARCIRGRFVSYVDLRDTFTSSASAPALGASVVQLTS